MSKKVITLSTKDELSIFMSPQRQQLLREMELFGFPLTPKMLAGKLDISASAVTHHIQKLIELGIVEQDHTEHINGILARFYKLADVTVSIGQQFDDDLSGERNAIIQNLMLNTLKSYNSQIQYAKQNSVLFEKMKDSGDFMSGVMHLTPEDGKNFLTLIRGFIESHSVPSSDTHPWEYAFILFDSEKEE